MNRSLFGSQAEPPASAVDIDSKSVGDSSRFRSLGELDGELNLLRSSPSDNGTVTLIVRRGARGVRESLPVVQLTAGQGLPGDAWVRQKKPHPEAALAVMQTEVAELIANGQPLSLAGDNLWLDLDLSKANLPPGSRLRIGGAALLEVTPLPHDGCRKFAARFGADARTFVCQAVTRHRNLRGVYLRVLEGGEIRTGDRVSVVSRPESM